MTRPESPAPYDESREADGRVRAPYADLLDHIGTLDLHALTRKVNDRLADDGVLFGGADAHPFRVDPVPRILTRSEWHDIERGVRQRMRALDALVRDAYGARDAVAAGVLPERVLEQTPYFEHDLVGAPPPAGGWVAIAGFDLVRAPDGRFAVLEDNLRTPSGLAYAQAAADVVADALGDPTEQPRPLAVAARALRRALEATAPDRPGELVLLSDGATNSAWYEHRLLADAASLRLVTLAELRRPQGRLELDDGTPVRAVYRRTDDDRVRDDAGDLTSIARLLLDPVRSGEVGMVNRFGTGVGDDKALYAYGDHLVRHFLGEEPHLRSVPTYDVVDPARRDVALERLPDLVAKPRDGHGGHGVVVGPVATADELDRARAAILADPEGWIVQDVVHLSTAPVVVDGALEPRHVDLRVFAVHDGHDATVVPGGLTRVALEPGSMVVNSSRRGGAKATWLVD